MPASETKHIVEDYDASNIECDGSFPSHDAECAGSAGNSAILLEKKVGMGRIIVTSIHEFPSRAFLQQFCNSGLPVQI
jgi:hypothetical protein